MDTNKNQDILDGKKYLNVYFGYMKSFYPLTYGNYSFEKFYELLIKIKGGKALADGLGGGIREAGLSSSNVNESMKQLARSGNGKVPASQYDFFKYLIEGSKNISYVDAIAFTVVETAKDVASGLESVGGQLIFTGKFLNLFLPVIIIGALYFYFKEKIK